MKIGVTVALLLATLSALAQKKELKEAEKLVNTSQFEAAKPLLTIAESKLEALKPVDKSKLYRLKALAFSGNAKKASLDDFKTAIAAYNKILSIEKASKSIKYTGEALDGLNKINYDIETKAQNSISNGAFIDAARTYEYLYAKDSKDTIYLYNTAISYVKAKEYDKSLEAYQKLLNLGYTGKGTSYVATHVASGQDHEIQSKADMDALVAKGEYTDPREVKLESKRGIIAKDIALIHIAKGDEAKAVEAFKVAKQENPDDKSVLDAEVNMYLVKAVEYSKTKDIENALKYYKKVLSINPSHSDANYNISAILLQKDGPIVDKINALAKTKAADNEYKTLRKARENNFNEAIPFMEKYLEKNPDDKAFAGNLLSIYKAVKSPKTESFKTKHGL
ncbi:tetratricopeptide repeat protein [Aquimarina agarilytica]|uniref:tetratricopeptide repeat protein n=1 Tax=Aquimarina agarilytica TaxID=1087449 RepID=UPI0002885F1D|nr:tetratricopeptide repeat protein [Aquimarina agarilytica]